MSANPNDWGRDIAEHLRQPLEPQPDRRDESWLVSNPDLMPVNRSSGETDDDTAFVADAFADSDMANARRLAKRHGRDLRFTPERGYLCFDGQRWAPDEKGVQVQIRAKDAVRAIYDEIRDAPDDAAQKDLFKHARRSQAKNAIESMIWLTRSEPGIPARLTDFDADPWLLNVVNGTLDLRTGQLRPHRREDLITRLAQVEFDPQASSDLWEAFLWRVTGQQRDLYDYLRRLVGYLLTGLTTEQVLHFLFGLGANGKSVFCEIVLELLGDYAVAASPDLVMARRHAGIPNDVARLRGVRVAMMNETSQGARFDEAKLKDLTGGDTISGRFLREEFFDFKPTHRLVIRGNHKPAINGTDEGIWRRLRLVSFTVAIPPEEQDRELLTKLRAELPGILTWAVQGCLEWQRDGLNPPPMITEAVRRYREESDVLGRFIGETCNVRPLAQIKSSVLFKRYQEYCEQAGERWIPSKDLPSEMERRGFTYKRITDGVRVYIGVELRDFATSWGSE